MTNVWNNPYYPWKTGSRKNKKRKNYDKLRKKKPFNHRQLDKLDKIAKNMSTKQDEPVKIIKKGDKEK